MERLAQRLDVVDPERLRRPGGPRPGVYRALYASVVDQARLAGDVFGIRLYVDQDNRTAQEVYTALGMSQSHYHMYEVEFPREDRT